MVLPLFSTVYFGNELYPNEPGTRIYEYGPFAFYYGNFAVCVFFVLSGLVLTYKYYLTWDKSIILDQMLRRYPRLVLPILALVMISFAFYKFGLMATGPASALSHSTWLAEYFVYDFGIQDILREGFLSTFIETTTRTLNTVLWTMKYEFIGSMVLLFTCLIMKRVPWLIGLQLVLGAACYAYSF